MAIEANYSRESEREAIAAALNEKKYAEMLVSQLSAESFYMESSKIIFRAIEELLNHDAEVSVSSVSSILRDKGELKRVGGEKHLSDIARDLISLSASVHHIEQIIAKSNLRKLKLIIGSLYKKLDDTNTEAQHLVEVTKEELEQLKFATNSNKDFKKSSEVVDELVSKIKDLREGKTAAKGIKTRFKDLNKMTNGFQRGDLVILAARPAMGKSALALNFAIDASNDTNEEGAVVFFSLEMPAEQLFIRMLSSESHVNATKLKTGLGITTTEWAQITSAANKLKTLNLYIDDTPGLDIQMIKIKLRNLHAKVPIKLVILDYLQIVTTPGKNLVQEFGMLSRNFKLLARDLNLSFVSLAQLSRAVEKRENKRPIMSDLRDSGSIEQDADIIMFIYRESYYERETADDEKISSEAELIVAKHRNGSTGTVMLTFASNLGTFENKNG